MSFKPVALVVSVILLSFCYAHGTHRSPPRLITLNPKGLADPRPFGYSHIRVDLQTRVAYIAGQVAFDVNATIVGKDNLKEQLEATVNNINIALKAIGASIDNIISINTFIKNFDPAKDFATFQQFGFALGSPVNTLISVPSLALEDLLVEIEVRAIPSKEFVRRQYRKYLYGSKKEKTANS